MYIRGVGAGSLAKFMGAFYGLIGLIIGAMFTLAALFGMALGASDDLEAWMAPLIGVGAIIIFPLFYGFMGFVMGLISAWIFNIVAGLTGGLEVDLE